MAPKVRHEQSSKPNKIRFVMLEADLNDGNFSDLAVAITHALRPQYAAPRTSSVSERAPRTLEGAATVPDIDEATDDDSSAPMTKKPASESEPKQNRALKRFPVPDYKHDLDMQGSAEAFKDYATRLAPKSTLQRYLVSMLWLKDFGQSPTADIHKIYTCFRTAGWPTKISDWDSAFRSLKQVDKVRRTENGAYAITPIGEDGLA